MSIKYLALQDKKWSLRGALATCLHAEVPAFAEAPALRKSPTRPSRFGDGAASGGGASRMKAFRHAGVAISGDCFASPCTPDGAGLCSQ